MLTKNTTKYRFIIFWYLSTLPRKTWNFVSNLCFPNQYHQDRTLNLCVKKGPKLSGLPEIALNLSVEMIKNSRCFPDSCLSTYAETDENFFEFQLSSTLNLRKKRVLSTGLTRIVVELLSKKKQHQSFLPWKKTWPLVSRHCFISQNCLEEHWN